MFCRQGTALAFPAPKATSYPGSKPAFPLCGWIATRTIGDKRPSMSSSCSGVSQYYGEAHAPHETSAARRGNLSGLHDGLLVRATAYSSRLCPASDKADQPGDRRNRHSREAHGYRRRQPSIPDETHRKDGRSNFDAQVSSTDSKATESSPRIGRAFSIRLLICQLRAIIPTAATT